MVSCAPSPAVSDPWLSQEEPLLFPGQVGSEQLFTRLGGGAMGPSSETSPGVNKRET